MILNRTAGAEEFDRLLARYPNDGMLFLERGEAAEHLNLLDEAEADYRRVEAHLTSPHWKDVARLAQRRVHKTRTQPGRRRFVTTGHQQWDAFHRLHGLAQLPHDVRRRALSAIARISAEPESAAVDLRWCIEVVVGELERQSGNGRSSKELRNRIEDLKQARQVSPTVAEQMDSVREVGRQGAHPESSSRRPDWVTGLAAFVAVLEWAETRLWQ